MTKPQPRKGDTGAAKAAADPKAEEKLAARNAELEQENAALKKQLAGAKPAQAPAAAAVAGALKKPMDAKHLIQKFGHRPKYELTEKAYIDDVMYDPEEPMHPVTRRNRGIDEETGDLKPLIIEFDGVPGPHMIPHNDCAKAMVAEHAAQYGRSLNPVDSLTIVGPGATVLKAHNAPA